jgi:hypothetical protein
MDCHITLILFHLQEISIFGVTGNSITTIVLRYRTWAECNLISIVASVASTPENFALADFGTYAFAFTCTSCIPRPSRFMGVNHPRWGIIDLIERSSPWLTSCMSRSIFFCRSASCGRCFTHLKIKIYVEYIYSL